MVVGRKPETEPVSNKPRKDMKVRVKNFLSRGNTIGKKEIDALTTNAATPNGRGQALSYNEHMGSDVRFDISQVHGVRVGHDQQVPRIDGLNVHECANLIIPMDDACRLSAGNNDRGVPYTREGMAFRGNRILLLPEDGPSRLFVFERQP